MKLSALSSPNEELKGLGLKVTEMNRELVCICRWCCCDSGSRGAKLFVQVSNNLNLCILLPSNMSAEFDVEWLKKPS